MSAEDRRPGLAAGGEFDLIRRIAERVASDPRITLGIGDDCAVIRGEDERDLLVTTDMLMDGRHFQLGPATPEQVGYKALAVNLSDIAAMAGEPVAAFVAVALPRGNAVEIAEGLLRGMLPLASEFGVALAGGDTNAWDGPLVICITVIGDAVAPGPVTRSGAEPGDVLFVTGPLGGSLAGRHLAPRPRVFEALALHRAARLKAMIDLSDGLSSDLAHVLKASGDLGATIEADLIPIHPDAHSPALRDQRSALEHALHDGEDFELCFAVSAADAAILESDPPQGTRPIRIGTIRHGPGMILKHADGSVTTLQRAGFDHLAGPNS